MAKKGDNLKPLHDAIRDAKEKIASKETERQTINDEIEAVRSELQMKGIGRKPFDMAMKYIALDADQRRAFDLAYQIVRDALGAPLQRDLFDDLDTMTPEDMAKAAGVDSEEESGDQ